MATKPSKDQKFKIEISLSNDNEPRDIFVGGCEEGDFRIRRGKPVTVPISVLERLDNAVVGVAEIDDEDPNKTTFVERKRFPYTVLGTVPA